MRVPTLKAEEKEGKCDYCGRESPSLSSCSDCRKAWYCSNQCLEDHWKIHRLYCLDPSELTSADRLALAAFAGSLPRDTDVLKDFGFLRAHVPSSRNHLLDLFRGIFNQGGIDPRVIHQFMLDGRLVDCIKTFYEAIPEANRGECYPWFLRNQHLLMPPPLHDTAHEVLDDNALQHAWWFIGGSASDTPTEIKPRIQSWPEEKHRCFKFIQLLLRAGFQLTPDRPEWLQFGFCGCKSEAEETRLWVAYLKLIKIVTFDQFCNAYIKSSLPALFSTHSLPIANPLVLDVLGDVPHRTKSVWNLKQFALGYYQQLTLPVSVDYGFSNCGDEETIYSLQQVYRKLFVGANANPLKLHEACLQGKLFEHVKQLIRIDPKFALLMKNIHPAEPS
ncbi:unnamed protein product [Rhizoctonia solani]|uniref:MYND-type domain-containing protein n=1 Tax=Rhizoctonia solani TaxID=456999 RepID=A0A8H3CEJ7_9AGAM|nr:unnamed protein product [Rhizoctonia solani]